MRKTFLIVVAVLFVLAQTPAQAWNYSGHRIIASIAYRQLDDATRAKVADVLKAHPAYQKLWLDRETNGPVPTLNLFYNAAVWPDDARSDPWKDYGRSVAHYVNFRIMANDGNKVLPPVDGENILNSYVAHVRKLEEKQTPAAKRADHLAWIFHQAGDIHMPLHAAARFSKVLPNGDRGGNEVKCPNPRGHQEWSGNLHGYWDDLISSEQDPAVIERVAGELIVEYPRARFVEELKRTNIGQWAEESLQACQETVYRTLDPNIKIFEALPIGYEADAIKVARKRGALAGYRLADQIKASFSDPSH